MTNFDYLFQNIPPELQNEQSIQDAKDAFGGEKCDVILSAIGTAAVHLITHGIVEAQKELRSLAKALELEIPGET